ncbi:MAG: hypothetical protein QM500_17745 [Methylococcales bacterium]
MAGFNLYNTLENDLAVDSVNRTVSVIPQLSKKYYAQVKSILTRLGGEWNSQRQEFTFDKCPVSLIERVLTVGSRQLNKFHLYPTQDEVFDYIKEYTPLNYFGTSRDVIKVLEPSCGEGNMIAQLKTLGEQTGRNFDIQGYDIDPLNIIFCEEGGYSVEQADFLEIQPLPVYDLVLMNPPFNGTEFIKHIMHAQKFLKSDGLLISVIPTHWLSNISDKKNCSWLLEQAQIESAADMMEANFFEPGVFKGVSINTAVITLPSVIAAERTLNSDVYKAESIHSFDFWLSNIGKYWNTLCELQRNRPADSIVIESVEKLVSDIMNSSDDDHVHLVRRFEYEYVNALMNEWFPDIHYSFSLVMQEGLISNMG